MGCSSSKLTATDHLDGRNHLFKVIILTSKGHDGANGKLEITNNELILYQKEEPLMRWPLTGLRHYGFNEDLFSFESGRRCPSGEGIFAFRCRSAETLYNVLQENIRYTAEQNIRLSTSNRLAAINQAALLAQFREGINGQSAASSAAIHNYENTVHDYINTLHDYENSIFSPVFYAELDLPENSRPSVGRVDKSSRNRHSMYASISPISTTPVKPLRSASGSKRQTIIRRSCFENRACTETDEFDTSDAYRGRHNRAASLLVLPRSQSCKAQRSASKRLSVARDGSASAMPSVDAASSYAAIDFERTKALSGRRLSFATDEGIRKTRHSVTTEAADLL